METDLFYGPFKNKYTESIIVEDIYSDSTFYNYYDRMISNYREDIDNYVENIKMFERILEIGSGSGRTFKPIYDLGFDIYGLEPSLPLVNLLEDKYKNKILLCKFEEIPYQQISLKFDVFIMTATTISLFDLHQINELIDNMKLIGKNNFKFMFDTIKETNNKYFELNFNQLENGDKIFYQNFIIGDRFVFNIYSNKYKKLGYSVKYIHSFKDLYKLFESKNMKLTTIYTDEKTTMYKAELK
ncbi:class I SAM-dependent methyltransferase [Staphylococcus pseudintermedius]|nr:methyltransferase domain-containing protein [Staphylococcus pseudintermedius]EGQ3409287.1 class I SAM-dependent methyltransferase [Staphylococcus pseudintermedius]EGQ3539125.1 class I SAM-dependent methyltransferase [Staphylococcus pseudintermedius]EGQ3973924.1 hypothetical protein [Staphylococcus pseudintermedius]EII6301069.1 class I SAM-dependent methyltransferase [Staphylococcus pseudintermedius]EJA1891165.1 class I SAM-dependent methyltransferase [Staphylococcus pseudintermedius]